MASQLSLFLMSPNDQPQEPTVALTKPVRPPTVTTTAARGRKPKNKCQPSKKQPQRGLGVAQLERLRLQDEKWKANNTHEANQLNPLNLIHPTPTTTRLHVFDDPPVINNNNHMINSGSTTVTNDPMHYGVPTMINGANGFLGVWDQLAAGMVVKRVDGNFGFNNGAVYGSTSPQASINPYNMVGVPVHHQDGTLPDRAVLYETSKELSSMPKQMQPQQYEPFRCDVCLKKKRFSTGEIIGHNNRRIDNFGERSSPTNGSCFLGLNQGNNVNLYGQTGGFSARAAKSAFYANHNHSNDKGAQVMAIHRKGNYSLGENNIFMEYEFLPGKNGRSTFFKEVEFGAEDGSVAMGTAGTEAAASCVTSASDHSGYSAYNASNSIDLSLKLSY